MKRHHLLPLVPKRIKHLLDRLEQQIWMNRVTLAVEGGPVNDDIPPYKVGKKGPWQQVEPQSYFGPQGGAWASRWHRVRIPQASKTKQAKSAANAKVQTGTGTRYLHWDCNGESTVYHQDKPWAGLDVAHTYCAIPKDSTALLIETGMWQTGVWHPSRAIEGKGCRFDGAWIAERDEVVWDAFCQLDVLQMVMERQLTLAGWKANPYEGQEIMPPAVSRLGRMLLNGLDAAADVYELEGAAALSAACSALMASLPAADHQGIAALTGHAHLDLVWLWPESVTRRKMAHTSATLLRLMERYPEFRFSGSQPYLYRALAEDEPALAADVQKRLRSGQWEIEPVPDI